MLMDTNGHIYLCEDYVSFETAKLLKEKGFKNEYCDNMLLAEDGDTIWKFATFTNWDDAFDVTMKFKKQIPYVTHQMALKWLREVHNIHIEIRYMPSQFTDEPTYKAMIWNMDTEIGTPLSPNISYTYFETCVEAALKYTLENLI